MSAHRQNIMSRPMDKEKDNFDDIINSLVSDVVELAAALAVQQVIAQHHGGVVEDGDVTYRCSSPAPSEESIMTCYSWPSNTDSDISDEILYEAQDLSEEIRKACQSFVGPENQEEEYFGDRDELLSSDTGYSTSTSIWSEESDRPASCASSSSIITTTEALQTLQSTKSVRTLAPAAGSKIKLVGKPVFKKIKSPWTRSFRKKMTKRVKKVSAEASAELDLTSTPLELVEEEEGQKEQDKTPAEDQQSSGLEQLFADPPQADEHHVMEICLPPGSSEEDGSGVFSQEENAEASEQQPVLNSSTIASIIRRFFESLTEEQWREVSEGVYNRGVKEQLTDMCTDVLKNISDSVTRTILQSSSTSGTFNLTGPMSSEHLMKLFNCNIQSCVESSLSQAVCQVIGEDIPARISPELTQATVTEVLGEVNSVLTTQASSSTAAPASSRVSKDRAGEKCLAGAISTMKSFLTGRGTLVMRRIKKRQSLEPNNKEEKAARGHSTRRRDSLLKRCLIARLMSKIQPAPVGDVTEPQSDQNSKADLRVTPVELEDYTEDGDKSPDSSLSAIDSVPPELHEDTSTSSQCQSKDSGDEETFSQCVCVQETEAKRRNGFCRFFCKILSKDQKNKRKETDENEAKEARPKQVPLWIQRLFGRCSSNK